MTIITSKRDLATWIDSMTTNWDEQGDNEVSRITDAICELNHPLFGNDWEAFLSSIDLNVVWVTEKTTTLHGERRMTDIIDCDGIFEVHPGAKGGWSVVNSQKGNVRCSFSDLEHAIDEACKLKDELDESCHEAECVCDDCNIKWLRNLTRDERDAQEEKSLEMHHRV